MKNKIWLPILFISLMFLSCSKEEGTPIIQPIIQPISKAQYLHISHMRTTTIPKMDSIAEKIDKSQ